MTRKTAVAHFPIIVWAVLFTVVVSAQQITLKPGAIRDNEIHRTNARDFAYCEITPVFGKPPNAMAQIYSSSGPGDRCPPNEKAAIDRRSWRRSLERSLFTSTRHNKRRDDIGLWTNFGSTKWARLWTFMAFGPLGWPRCRQSL